MERAVLCGEGNEPHLQYVESVRRIKAYFGVVPHGWEDKVMHCFIFTKIPNLGYYNFDDGIPDNIGSKFPTFISQILLSQLAT